jgi:GT2 family glycosyltransferase
VKPDVSVVIVSYNVRAYLCSCIDSLLMQEGPTTEIIVVDNHSTDDTKEVITNKYPSVRFIANIDNKGFSAANNQGIKAASAEIILLLNPDTELPDTATLKEIKIYIDANPDTAIMAPRLLNTDGSFQPSFWEYKPIKDTLLQLIGAGSLQKMKQPVIPTAIQVASGAALIFRKALIGEVGGLDENMFWMEDIDFCYKAWKKGKKIIFHPGIKIIHHGGKSSVGNEVITIPNQVISKIKFSRKNDPALLFYAVNLLSLFFIISRLLIFAVISLISSRFKYKRKAYLITLKRYFRLNLKGDNTIITQ